MCAPQANVVIHADDSLSLKVCTMGWAVGWVSVIHELFKICFLDHGRLRVLYNACNLYWFSKLDIWGLISHTYLLKVGALHVGFKLSASQGESPVFEFPPYRVLQCQRWG